MGKIKCPNCESEEIECLEPVDIIDQVDEDNELRYYIALYFAICKNCSERFTYEDDYTERKLEGR